MPLGDPMGEETQYDRRGFLLGVSMVAIPVRDLASAITFYQGTLGLTVQRDARSDNWVELGPSGSLGRIALYVPDKEGRRPGGPTGIVLATESIYDLHRKLVDRGVHFVVKPEKRRVGGLIAIFLDPDGNHIAVVEETLPTVPEIAKVGASDHIEKTPPKRTVTEY